MKPLIDHINGLIAGIGLFKQVHGLFELLSEDGIGYPAGYCANGEYKKLGLDNVQAEIYHRHDGAVQRQIAAAQTAACDATMRQAYPMLLIGFVSRETLGDSAYTMDDIAAQVINAIEFRNNKPLQQSIRASSVAVNVTSYGVDFNNIFNREFSGNPLDNLNLKYCMFEIRYEIIVEGNKSCFQYCT